MPVQPVPPLRNPALVRPESQRSVPRPEDRLWLDKNENLDPELLASNEGLLRAMPARDLATYPEPAVLYAKLAAWIGVTPSSLILTPGSDGAIRLTFEAFIREGDVVAHTFPTFAMYPVYCQMFGADPRPVAYRRGAGGPELGRDEILAHLDRHRPKLFCLPNPDSPTGTVLAESDLRAVVEHCEAMDTVVLVDEAYHPFHRPSCTTWTRDHRNLVVARTFAKAWGLAGLRIGYAVGHPETIAWYHKLRPMYELGAFSIAFMERAMDNVGRMEKSVARIADGKAHFVQRMRALGFDVPRTEGNFQHVAFGASAPAVHAALEGKVLYRRDFADECLRGYSRFSVAPRELLEPVIGIIERATSKEGTASA